MGNIITDTERSGGGWTADRFFAYGREEIEQAMERLTGAVPECRMGRALDFGCGIGRVTQALAGWFRRVDGVDVSSVMVELARAHNDHVGRVEYHVNDSRLPFRAGTFDFVYSMVVFQHMPVELQESYVRECFRVLKRGGVAMLHLPDGPDSGDAGSHLRMCGVPPGVVEGWFGACGARVVDVEDLGVDGSWRNLRYSAVLTAGVD